MELRRITLAALALALALAFSPPFAASALAKTAYPDSELRAVEAPSETKLRQLREEEATQLRILLGRRSPSNRRADLYLRLAEIYMEAYRQDYLLEGRIHDKHLAAGQDEQYIDHSHSQPDLLSGVKACRDILALGIAYGKMDEVYYFLAYNSAELGDHKEGLKYYSVLIQHYPESQYVSEGYSELGEAAYNARDFRKAQTLFELGSRKSPPDILPRILHRLAWSYYRTKDYERAISTMKQAIEQSSQSGEKFLNLREEALRDMAIFMTEGGRVEDAIAYFQGVIKDKSFYPKTLEKLGKQYEHSGDHAKATQVYESLLKTHPESEAAFRVLVKLVDLDLGRGDTKGALSRLGGVKIPGAGESDTLLASQNLRAMIRRTATESHENFRKTQNRGSLETAELYYAAYLSTFLAVDDSRNETPEIEMYLAEVKRDLGKSNEASALYRKVVDSKDPRYAKEAGALWTQSLADAISKSAANQKTRSTEPAALEIEYVEAADRLQDALGDTPEGREAALKAAQVLAGYKSTQSDAVRRIKKLIATQPKTPQALTAARLWLQMMADRYAEKPESTDDLKEVIKGLRENLVLMATDRESGQTKLTAQMIDQETRMKVGVIAKEEKDKDFAAAAKGYESFAMEVAQKDLAEKAYANAVLNYFKVPDPESVDRVSSDWLKRFPKSAKAVDSIRGAATNSLIAGRFEVAAKLFDKLGRIAADSASLDTAGRIYEGVGDNIKAQDDWNGFLDLYKQSSHRWEVALELAKSYESSKMEGEAGKIYKFCMTGPAEFEAECGSRLAALYFRIQNPDEGKATLKHVASQAKTKKGEGLSVYVAYARYRLAFLMEQEAKLEPLRLPDTQLKKAVNQRLEFLEPLSRAYNGALEAGGPWGIAALERLATWAYEFAAEVDQITAPVGTDENARLQLEKTLKSLSEPLRKKALATWNEGYSRALATETLSPALPGIADRLADEKTQIPFRAQGPRGKFRLAGMPADGGPDGLRTALSRVRDKLLKNPQDAVAWMDYGNLLWGTGKPLLARLAYEYSLTLNGKSPAAMNNRAVVAINSGESEEDWLKAADAAQLFQNASKQDDAFIPAKFNRGLLLNYYRLFAKSRPLWEQIKARADSAEVEDGLAVALQGMGEQTGAALAFTAANSAGAPPSRFASVYNEAARIAAGGVQGANQCLARLGDLDATITGFEKQSAEHLKGICTAWKSAK